MLSAGHLRDSPLCDHLSKDTVNPQKQMLPQYIKVFLLASLVKTTELGSGSNHVLRCLWAQAEVTDFYVSSSFHPSIHHSDGFAAHQHTTVGIPVSIELFRLEGHSKSGSPTIT